MRPTFALLLFAATALLLACSDSAPPRPVAEAKPDPFKERWSLAQEAFRKSEFKETLTQLKIVQDQAEDPAPLAGALAWRALLLGGLARGYTEMILACEQGIEEAAPEAKQALEVERGGYFRGARINALQLLESAEALQSAVGDSDTIRMDFTLPEGDYSPSPLLARVASGIKPEGNLMAGAVDYTLRRNVFLQAADMIGTHGDLARAQSLFSLPPVTVPRTVYFLGVAQTLYTAQDMFIDTRIRNREAREQVLSAARRFAQPASDSGGRALQEAANDLIAQIEYTETAMEAERRRLGVR